MIAGVAGLVVLGVLVLVFLSKGSENGGSSSGRGSQRSSYSRGSSDQVKIEWVKEDMQYRIYRIYRIRERTWFQFNFSR